MSGKLVFKKHKSLDASDPGFTVVGRKLRWIAAYSNENNFSRPWEVITKEDLLASAPDLLKDLERRMPGMFAKGNTIRKGVDLVLAMAPLEVLADLKSELKQKAARMESMIRAKPQGFSLQGKEVGVEHEVEQVTLTADDFKKERS